MKQTTSTSIPNLIGILLVIVALVSAGGLYYTASVYTRISETYVAVESMITDVTVTYDNTTGEVQTSVSVLVNNSSSLDIDVYRVEFMTYMDKAASTVSNYNRYVGSGSSSDRNNTVKADTVREITISFIITSDSTYYDRFAYATSDGPYVWMLVVGTAWYKVSDYDVKNQLDLFSMENMEVLYV